MKIHIEVELAVRGTDFYSTEMEALKSATNYRSTTPELEMSGIRYCKAHSNPAFANGKECSIDFLKQYQLFLRIFHPKDQKMSRLSADDPTVLRSHSVARKWRNGNSLLVTKFSAPMSDAQNTRVFWRYSLFKINHRLRRGNHGVSRFEQTIKAKRCYIHF